MSTCAKSIKRRNKCASRIDKLFLFTLVVNIVIPKAGIKVSGIPITLGNVFILFLFINTVFKAKLLSEKIGRRALFFIVYELFWIIRMFVAVFISKTALSEIIGYLTSLCVYPLAYYITPLYVTRREQAERIFKIVSVCLLFLFIYTLLQAIFGIGRLTVPGITVNYTDYAGNPDSWWLDKNNGVGEASKMVATYQNGNLLGVTLILLFPVGLGALKLKRVKAVYWIMFVMSVLLAGSRAVYIGLALTAAYYSVKWLATAYLKVEKWAMLFFIFIVAVFALAYFIISLAPDMVDRIMSVFDLQTLFEGAGRTAGAFKYLQWVIVNPAAFLFGGTGMAYDGFAYEMTYLCVFLAGGLVGTVLFLKFLWKPLRLIGRFSKKDLLIKSIFTGLAFYWIVAFVEGGYWLPPVAWNVWLIAGLGNSCVKNMRKEL